MDALTARRNLSDSELLIYATLGRGPLYLPPAKVALLDKLLKHVGKERTPNAKAWHVDRSSYEAKAG